MSNSALTYECHNRACTLGSRKDPGLFTGGMTEDQAYALIGEPDTPYGEGICPNCGEKAQPYMVDGEHYKTKPMSGNDPLQSTHDQLAAKVKAEEMSAEDAQKQINEKGKRLAARQ